MRIQRVVRRRLRSTDGAVHVVGDLNAVIAANVGEAAGSHQESSSHQSVSIVQTGGHTTVRHRSADTAAGPEQGGTT